MDPYTKLRDCAFPVRHAFCHGCILTTRGPHLRGHCARLLLLRTSTERARHVLQLLLLPLLPPQCLRMQSLRTLPLLLLLLLLLLFLPRRDSGGTQGLLRLHCLRVLLLLLLLHAL